MKNNIFKIIPAMLAVVLAATGCNKADDNQSGNLTNISSPVVGNSESSFADSSSGTEFISSSETANSESEASSENGNSASATLKVCFGDRNKPFILHLYDNDTAAAVAKHVGTADWQLPIYHYDDYENWEVMQYYDVPSRYEIPSAAESISSEKAGEVYYSEPNRIVLFFGDAQVSGEYTKVGYFDFTEEFKSAVENNPVVQGWGNKIVIIQPGN